MSWKGKERFSLLEEGMGGSIYTCEKGCRVRKTCTEVSIVKDLVLHKIFSDLRGLINGYLSW